MIAIKPPMGWNSWNTFGKDINDSLIRQIADTMVEKGYLEAGYEYLIIDDCWSLKERDNIGNLVPDPEKFPNGMKSLADYVHSKGLKFGMYSCAGILTCAGYPSSYDHEFQDAALFAEWGIDYLKYDYCNFPKNADCINRYQTMSMALKATGKNILFAACNWGSENSWSWMRSIGAHTYRSTGDIFDNFRSFMGIFQSQLEHLCQSGPYCFNDMDMLVVGMYGKGNVGLQGCSDVQYRTHFSIWAFMGSPLMIGCDIRNMSQAALEILGNEEVIRINQDRLCRQPVKLVGNWSGEDLLLYSRQLENGDIAIGMFNLGEGKAVARLNLDELGLPFSTGRTLDATELWSGEKVAVQNATIIRELEPFGCAMIRAKVVRL